MLRKTTQSFDHHYHFKFEGKMASSASIIPSASIHQRQDSKCAQLDLWSRITGDALLSKSPPSSSCLLQERHNSPRHHPPTHRRNATAPYFNNNFSQKHSELIIEHDIEPLLAKVEVPRYAEAQYGRTLHHPNMKQPSMDQEERHLAMLFAQRNRLTNEEEDVSLLNNMNTAQNHDTQSVGMAESAHQQELVEKLSKALLLGSTNSNHELAEPKGHDHFPSPTSTLFFPDSSFDNTNSHSPNDEYAEDSFIGTCGLVSSELEKLKYSNHSIGSHNYECVEVEGHASSTAGNATFNNFGELECHTLSHSFVICSDTQLGISSKNMEWETELEYSRQAVRLINDMSPPPRFVCVCGDLIDMEYTFEANKGYSSGFKSKEECDKVQDQQNEDFKRVWKEVNPDVALVCLCGNHDVGNRPTPESIQRYKDSFGDEYLSFWTNGTYNIVINNVLFVDPSGAQDMFDKQLVWLEDRLKYAHEHNAKMVFVFGHHPFFLVRVLLSQIC